MTGRAAGYCAGNNTPGFANPGPRGGGFGRGGGRGFGGGGFGRRNRFFATGLPGWMRWGGGAQAPAQAAPANQREFLEQRVDALQAELSDLQAQLKQYNDNE
jgi:hypothetical protein